MKIVSLPTGILALVAGVALFTFPTQASAQVSGSIRFGTPPPDRGGFVDHRWARPYRGAVWIEPHYELIDGRWVWIRGFYTYPPRPGGFWVPGHYRHGYWRPGHWAY